MQVVRDELRDDPTIDITTTGRRSGEPRRIEIWMLDVAGRFYVIGTPGPRDWLANLRADPTITVHLTRAGIDVTGTARELTDEAERRAVIDDASARWYRGQADVADLVANAPMVEVAFDV